MAFYPAEDRFEDSLLDSREEDPHLGLGLGLLGGIGIGAGLAHWKQPKPLYILRGGLCGHGRPGCWEGSRRRRYRPRIRLGHRNWPHSFEIGLKASLYDEQLLDDMLEDEADAILPGTDRTG